MPVKDNSDLYLAMMSNDLVDNCDLSQCLLLFRANKTARNLKNLLSAFLTNPHGSDSDGFEDISSAAAELSTIPTGANRLKELADVAAFLCELSEEAADPTLDQRLNMDVYPLTFFKNVCRGVTEALGIRNTTSIRVWMVRIFQSPESGSSDPTREALMDEFFHLLGEGDLDLSDLTAVFRGPIPQHQTGTFVDGNLLQDPLRSARYYYVVARVLVSLGQFGVTQGYAPSTYLSSALEWIELSRKTLADLEGNKVFWERRTPSTCGKVEVELQRRRTAELAVKLETRTLLSPEAKHHAPKEIMETPACYAPEKEAEEEMEDQAAVTVEQEDSVNLAAVEASLAKILEF